jgi:hypothetical protein
MSSEEEEEEEEEGMSPLSRMAAPLRGGNAPADDAHPP